MTSISRCTQCKHYTPGSRIDNVQASCKAFPSGIPREVHSEIIFHYTRFDEQEGDYVFEPDENDDFSYQNNLRLLRYIKELLPQKEQLVEDIKTVGATLISNLRANGEDYARGEISLSREKGREMIQKVDDMLFFDSNGEAELYSLGYSSELFRLLDTVLYIDSIENHNTDLEFVMSSSGACALTFSKKTYSERLSKNELVSKLSTLRELGKNEFKGYKPIARDRLKIELQNIIDEHKNWDSLNALQIEMLLHKKGYSAPIGDIKQSWQKLISGKKLKGPDI